jgi:hypothetical protein
MEWISLLEAYCFGLKADIDPGSKPRRSNVGKTAVKVQMEGSDERLSLEVSEPAIWLSASQVQGDRIID